MYPLTVAEEMEPSVVLMELLERLKAPEGSVEDSR